MTTSVRLKKGSVRTRGSLDGTKSKPSARDGPLSHSRSSPNQSTKDGSLVELTLTQIMPTWIGHGLLASIYDCSNSYSSTLVFLFVFMIQYILATIYDTISTIMPQ